MAQDRETILLAIRTPNRSKRIHQHQNPTGGKHRSGQWDGAMRGVPLLGPPEPKKPRR